MHINSLKVSKCALEEDLLPSGHKTQVVENQAQAFSIRLVELQWKFKAQALRVWAVKSKDTDWQRVDFCNFWWIILVVSMTTITKMQAAARNCLHLIIWGRPHSSLASMSILARFSIAVIHHMTKSILRRKGLIQLYSSVYCGKKTGQETQCSSWNKGHGGELLTGLLSMAYEVYFLMQHRTTCPRVALPTVGWAYLTSITYQENTLVFFVGQSDEGSLSTDIPSV